MNIIFGDPFLAARTIRACGGTWVDLETHELEVRDTVFIESGALIRPTPDWKTSRAVFALGATLEEKAWGDYLKLKNKDAIDFPHPRSFFLSAEAIRQLNKIRKYHTFWQALRKLPVRRWVEPQLRNWFHPRLRVLQVVTSLQVGGAEKVCLELSSMSECIGIVSWGKAKRTPLATPQWDLSGRTSAQKVDALLTLAKGLHVDLIHTHLLGAKENALIDRVIPVITTMHNVKDAWPKGYDQKKPGYLVACSKVVAQDLKNSVPVAWNGVAMRPTRRKGKHSLRTIALIAVANFRSQKRLERLPAIMKAIQKCGYAVRLTVVGEVHPTDPDSRRAYKRFKAEARAARVSKLIKEVRTLDVRSQLARADVFVSTSAFEGLSLAQLEALGAGMPVVATNVGGAKEIQGETVGAYYVTRAANAKPEVFAKAIIEAHGKKRRAQLPAAFTVDSMKRRYRFLYLAALAKAGKTTKEIWLVTNNFSMGGAQTSARRLLTNLKEKETVRAWTLQEQFPTKGSQELAQSGVPVSNLAGENAREKCVELLRRCVIERPRAILFWNTMAPEKCLLADVLNIPIVDVSPGEMYFKEMERYLTQPIPELPIRTSQEYGRRLAGIAVKYGREKRRMKDFLGIPVTVIPNGITGINPSLRTFKRKVVFGTAARIAPHKRLEDMVKVFAQLDATFLIAGKVEPGAKNYFAALKKMSTPNIKWLGEQDVKKFLPKLDMFVMVSEPAGCPNASLEAMMSGLPLIATDVGGANEQVIDGKNGWLLKPRNLPAMKQAVEEALAMNSAKLKRMSEASLRHIKKFSIAKMATSYLRLLRSSAMRC